MTTKTVILAGNAAGNWGPSAEELGCAPTLTSASPQSQFSPGKGRWSRAVPCGIQSQQTHSTHQYEFWKYQLYTLIEYKDHHCHHRRPCQPMSQACVCLNMHKCCSSLRSYFCISSRFKVKGVTTYPCLMISITAVMLQGTGSDFCPPTPDTYTWLLTSDFTFSLRPLYPV